MIARETKAGLVVSGSFVCLVGVVLYSKMTEKGASAATPDPAAQQVLAPPDPTPTPRKNEDPKVQPVSGKLPPLQTPPNGLQLASNTETGHSPLASTAAQQDKERLQAGGPPPVPPPAPTPAPEQPGHTGGDHQHGGFAMPGAAGATGGNNPPAPAPVPGSNPAPAPAPVPAGNNPPAPAPMAGGGNSPTPAPTGSNMPPTPAPGSGAAPAPEPVHQGGSQTFAVPSPTPAAAMTVPSPAANTGSMPAPAPAPTPTGGHGGFELQPPPGSQGAPAPAPVPGGAPDHAPSLTAPQNPVAPAPAPTPAPGGAGGFNLPDPPGGAAGHTPQAGAGQGATPPPVPPPTAAGQGAPPPVPPPAGNTAAGAPPAMSIPGHEVPAGNPMAPPPAAPAPAPIGGGDGFNVPPPTAVPATAPPPANSGSFGAPPGPGMGGQPGAMPAPSPGLTAQPSPTPLEAPRPTAIPTATGNGLAAAPQGDARGMPGFGGASASVVTTPMLASAAGHTPPIAPVPAATMNSPQVDSYDEQMHRARPGDSFAAISQQYYDGSDRYAKALQQFNLNHPMAPTGMAQNPGQLAPNQMVFIPPKRILEKYYGSAIAAPAGGATPAAASMASASDRFYRVRQGGERYMDIAQRTLGDAMRWGEIYERNRYDPAYPIPAGTQLKLPGDAKIAPEDMPR